MAKRVKKISLSILTFVTVLCLSLLIVLHDKNNQEFDSTKWKNEQLVYGKDPIRKKMVHKLLKYGHLVGKSRDEINDMLGSPKRTGYFPEYDYVYWLGSEGGFGVDSLWLGISFDSKTDRVVQTKILTD